jgi:hypothetical protein
MANRNEFLQYVGILSLFLFIHAADLIGQDAAPDSVANTVAEFDGSVPGSPVPLASILLLSNDGQVYRFSGLDGVVASGGPYTWAKTSANTGTLSFNTGNGPSQVFVRFIGSSQGSYGSSPSGPTTGTVAFTPFVTTVTSPLRNVSSRMTLTSGQPGLVGFVVAGASPRRVLVRAIGPSLAQFGVANTAANPVLTVLKGGSTRGTNSGWGGTPALVTAFSNVGAFALPATSKDAAIILTLEAGAYTAQVTADLGGETLVEVYFAEP